MRARIRTDREYIIGEIDERLYGSFIEHLGRAVYGGIWEPGHPTADASGFRRDVADLVRELNVPLVRYPGGNFVSSFKWEDSVGPLGQRPRRLDLAWRAVEPNLFGLNEFMDWTRLVGTEAMMAVNLGTRGIEAAEALVEYCNHPGGSFWSDLRKAHGVERPHGIKLWCLGNEMDGPWQVGMKTPDEYGRIASETAKALKLFDPKLELVACGSSGPLMPTFPQWETTILDHCYDSVDYVSMHQYLQMKGDDLGTFLADSIGTDAFIETVVSACDLAKARKRSKRAVNISFDEWNVWYHSFDQDKKLEPWTVGPRQLEDIYDFGDALAAGCMLNSLVRHADRVKIACLAQLVNVIAPIMTRNGGGAWKQTIFWPFYYLSRFGRGISLDLRVESPVYDNAKWGDVPYLDSSAVVAEDGRSLSFFIVNRSPSEAAELRLDCSGFGKFARLEHTVLACDDPKAVNTETDSDRVAPRPPAVSAAGEEGATVVIPALSWNMVRFIR
ncbi:MAG TPA: alpha-N-arabinofuranosidase [Treponema sp.]|nr:MAG: alpha-N-arabinofuranosidase [Treponema sp. GWC1_61_84]OHE72693.1 MAG: alpha-N-arabinofuranosidase [Treponema sp. RIFOXYC1_FULL_61_9]HCM27756.1 alpha-N-arabinofuranosidase [Treponema sp.]